jgi:hypothetical protein
MVLQRRCSWKHVVDYLHWRHSLERSNCGPRLTSQHTRNRTSGKVCKEWNGGGVFSAVAGCVHLARAGHIHPNLETFQNVAGAASFCMFYAAAHTKRTSTRQMQSDAQKPCT